MNEGEVSGRPSHAGTLFLVPVGLGGGDPRALLPPATLATVLRISRFVVENAKSGRAFLKSCGYARPLREVRMDTLSEHTPAGALPAMIAPLLEGEDCGLMSEAGCPAVADPGANLVRLAHARGVRVAPLVGPSSILLALMASGLNGQHFEFHGYLPVKDEQRTRALRDLEEASARSGATQVFIETPYRNETLLRAVLAHCRADTFLCVATDLSLASERIATRIIADWRKEPAALGRRPTVFLLWRGPAAGNF